MTRRRRLSGQEALHAAFSAMNHAPLLERLGVHISEEGLRLALTHRSFANENGSLPNNERLEFLGDAVLGLSVATQLYAQYPSSPESEISKMRAGIVSRYGCADVARDIRLGEYVLLGKGELATGGRNKDSILADTTEAILGIIYREHGFEVARDVILRLFGHKIDTATAKGRHEDWKTVLQERLAGLKLPMASYESTSTGPEHDLLFTAQALLNGRVVGTGTGQNKKIAEQEAAHRACLALSDPQVRAAVSAESGDA
ncbi:ribonuclease III [Corynebacterium mastitidis]|uniref:Ribonuclease 3 n=1 Tax=Corynebacterium mastitidis TaxID=161890 RepID=A0A2N0X5I3_9CORY|nr:ribonuclease III [Corynebacterium mastitidis]MCH6196720.1 ribonuclease III [Corynebacterium mastitidis]MDK8449621.1 ribonuclease III [Corynebacterium mastitidis]PKF67964.1 ribonuclease III [Corynebacterium mastitidis]